MTNPVGQVLYFYNALVTLIIVFFATLYIRYSKNALIIIINTPFLNKMLTQFVYLTYYSPESTNQAHSQRNTYSVFASTPPIL